MKSHGSGEFSPSDFAECGQGCVFEPGVKVFHPENIYLGDRVYVGHDTILKGYYKNQFRIGSGTWIGQQGFFHAAGGLRIGEHVGVGPAVRVLTSVHAEAGRSVPILHSPIEFSEVEICSDSDLGVGSIILPGVTIGRGVQVGAGAVVTKSVSDYAIVAGVPARVIGERAK